MVYISIKIADSSMTLLIQKENDEKAIYDDEWRNGERRSRRVRAGGQRQS
jgi:hypothetical protein